MNDTKPSTKPSLDDALRTLDEVGEHLQSLPEASHALRELSVLKERVLKQQKTVAVFGAFSAGKSSLINALIGDNVLAVSPNPTTATISHVIPPLGSATQVHVVAKTRDQMWEDVRQAFQGMHRTPDSLEEAVEMANNLSMAQLSPSARRGASFLKAVAAGYATMNERLGTEWDIPYEDIEHFTADERHACYLQRVDIPHRIASLEGSNAVLVDTPGVDSIHRRHTEVAFHYMRQADAIVFVLYYTHAFSRADKDFLLQLAGVQDVVGLNKLFVAINAVDLATSEEERVAVRDRVEKELRSLGIRQPRVFELSAQVAFAAEQLKHQPHQPQLEQVIRQRLRVAPDTELPSAEELLKSSGLPDFTSELSRYMNEEAERLTLGSMSRFLSSTANHVHAVLESKRAQFNADTGSRMKLAELQWALHHEVSARSQVLLSGAGEGERVLRAEWDELMFHIGERIRLRFPSLFRETYHPGRFRHGTNPRMALAEAANELCSVFSKQVELECRTFGLRVEVRIQKTLHGEFESLQKELNQLCVLPLDAVEETTDIVNEYPAFRAEIHPQSLSTSAKHFKSAKQFFEEGGQSQMQSDVEPVVMEAVRDEVGRLLGAFVEFALESYRERAVKQLEQASARLRNAAEQMQSGISSEEISALEATDVWFTTEASRWQESTLQCLY